MYKMSLKHITIFKSKEAINTTDVHKVTGTNFKEIPLLKLNNLAIKIIHNNNNCNGCKIQYTKIYEFTKIFKQKLTNQLWRILDIQLIIQKTDKNPMFIQLSHTN